MSEELDRQELLLQAKGARERLAVLSEISDTLMSSLDYARTIPAAMRVAVPRVADWCAVHYFDGGLLVREIAHSDPALEKRIVSFWEANPYDPSRHKAHATVMGSSDPILLVGISDELLAESTMGPEHMALLRASGVDSVVTAPLRIRGETLGVLALGTGGSRRRLDQDDLALATLIARRCTIAIENSRLYESQGRAIERVSSLQRLTAALAGTMTEEEVAGVIVSGGLDALGAAIGVVSILNEPGTYFRNLRISGYPEEVTRQWPGFPADGAFPVADAVRLGEPIFLETLEARSARYPGLGAFRNAYEGGALAAVPMFLRNRPVGGIGYIFPQPRSFPPEDRDFLLALARECAQALERAGLFQKSKDAILLRDDFLSIAGHELRSPAHAVALIAESMLRRARANEPSANLVVGLQKLLEAVERLTRLTGDLLDVTHIAEGRLTLQRDRFDLAQLVSDVARRFEEVARRAGCGIETRLEPVIGTWDRNRLDQVITNVVGNACKFGAGSPVEIAVESDGDRARISVRDHGIGISEEDQARLFRRFERFETRRKFGGMGLGLWITRRIVAAHGGTIAVESVPGEGATFRIELPREA
ncbi:MAG: ATP-binding protein [Acidobacteriota bacterium]|nr:ATP-binding protein [Acidobacteriota bacterium]